MILPPKLILAPTDFSEPSNRAIGVAADLALQFGSELCLVHVVPVIPALPSLSTIFREGEYEQELHKQAEQQLAAEVQRFSNMGVSARFIVGDANDAAPEILRIAEHNSADLIVIATHGMTGWKRVPFGSVTDKVVRLADCPVLVLREKAQGQTANSSEASKSTAISV